MVLARKTVLSRADVNSTTHIALNIFILFASSAYIHPYRITCISPRIYPPIS